MTAIRPDTRPLCADPQTFMAFDFGQKRTGVAVGNRLMRTATPQPTVVANSVDERFKKIEQHILTWRPDALVVGVPFYPDGQAHANTLLAQKFARQLRGRFGLTVHEVDERYSTTEAKSLGATDHDAGAASVILEQFLRGLP